MIRAHIDRDFSGDGHRLLLVDVYSDGRASYLRNDGQWYTVDAASSPPPDAGIGLPRGGWEAICAIAAPSHPAQELAAVRDALTVERARVDSVLAALLHSRKAD